MISHKFSFPPPKPRDTAKRENCHHNCATDQKSDNRLKLSPTYPWLAIFYWQSITFTRTASRESHQMSPSALRAETSSRFEYDTLRTKFDTQLTLISHRRRKQLSSSAGLLFGVSSAITDRTQVLAIRALCFYISAKIQGQARPVINQL